jgi:hypothetical protein
MIILWAIGALLVVVIAIVVGVAIMGGPSSKHASMGPSEDSGEE